jgi:autotransporter-associated beta strand protein
MGILQSVRAQVLLTDSYLNPNAPTAGAELNDNLANRQTGSLATVGYSSSTLNSSTNGSGFAYLNESSNLEILSAVGTHANVWTTTGFATAAATSISVDLWPTVTQTNGSGFANFLIGGGLDNTKANDGVIFAGGAANAITVTLFGNGTLSIRDQSKFDGADSEYIYYNGSAFSNNGFKKLSIVTSALASGSQTLSFYLDDAAVLKNYTRAAGFTSGNYVGFQAYRNEGATQSVFDNLNISVGVFWSGGNGNWSSGFSPAIFDSLNATFDGGGGTAVNNISSASLSNVGSLVFGASAGAYTLTANSGSSGFSSATPIGIGGGITNNSGATQTINVATAFSSNASIAANAGNIAVNSDVAIGTGATLAVQGGNSTAINSVISGAGGLTKSGAGTLTFAGATANTLSGTTTVSAGTLQLNKSTDVAAIAGNVAVNSGATLLLSSSGNVANTSVVTLSGGTIRRGGNVSEVFGNLNVSAVSFLDFGAANAAGTLSFGTYTQSALLTVQNFLPGNKLQFASGFNSALLPTGGSLSNENFSFSNGFTTGTEDGYFTITAIPEPSTIAAAIGLVGVLLWPRTCRAFKDSIRGNWPRTIC